jgi:hypothetical protein
LPAVEAVFSGSKNGFNYGVTTGAWTNFTPNAAYNVSHNNVGIKEPIFGLYLGATLAYTAINLQRDEHGDVTVVTVNTPSLLARWNSSANRLNLGQILLRDVFSYQNRSLNFTVAPTVQYSDRLYSILPATLQLNSGLLLDGSLEFSDNTYYRLDILQALNSLFSVGVYTRNHTDVGNTRETGYAYGLKLRYNMPSTSLYADCIFGTTNLGLEVRLQGSFSF